MGTKIYTSKSSVKVFGDNTEDVVQKARERSILNFVTSGDTLYNSWTREMFMTKGQLLSYYRFAENGAYYLGLPDFTLQGVNYDETAVAAALASSLGGGPYTVLGIKENTLDIEMYWEYALQAAPYYYQPFLNHITYNGNTDWEIVSIYYGYTITNPFLGGYIVEVSRTPRDAKFWIEGPFTQVEGETATYTIYSNSWMPRSCSTTINIAYSGTLGAGRYTAPTSVVMPELTKKVTFDIDFLEDAVDDGTDTLIITLSSVVDTNSAFTAVAPYAPLAAVATTVYDNDPLVLEINSQIVSEMDLMTITIPITLSSTAAAPFTVDVLAVDGTAVQPVDYGLPPETLNFTGTAGETHNVIATWNGDVPDETEKTFSVTLSNCSDPAIEVVPSATIVITASVKAQPAVVLGTEVFDEIELSGTYEGDDTYMQVRYHDNTHDEVRWYWWLYRIADNTYPSAHAVYSTKTIDDMYPVSVIRRQKSFTNANKDTEVYRDTRMIMKRIRMEIDDITDNVAEQDGYEDVDDVFVNFAFSPNDTHPLISKLLFHHFYNVIVNLAVVSNNGEYRTYFEQQDANNETTWYDHEFTDDLSGTIPDGTGVGSYSHSITSEISGYYTSSDGETEVPIYQDWLHIYYQKTETTYSYIKLRDLKATSQISYAGYTRYKVNGLVERSGHWGEPSVDKPEYLTIPLSRMLIDNHLDYEDQMIVYQHLFRIDVYSLQIVKTEWYESGIFKGLFFFIAVVVTISSFGAGATLFSILQTVVVNILILKFVVFVAEVTGNAEFAVIVGIVASIVLGGAGFGSGFDIGTAEMLTSSVTKFSEIYTSASEGILNEMEDELSDIQQETQTLLNEIDKLDLRDSGITGEYYRNMLKSVDLTIVQGRDIQYNFDTMLGDAYNRLITDFHENMLQPGIV